MKKNISFFLLIVSSMFLSQQMISFEASEGYNIGNINNQQGWKSTIINSASPYYIESQLVTSELYTEGSNSLKVLADPMLGPQEYSVVGAFYSFETPISSTDFTISFDVRINQQNENSSNFEFIGVTKGNDPKVVYYLILTYKGGLSMVQNTVMGLQTVETASKWNADTWYRLKIVGTADNISYYLNNNFVGSTSHLSDNPTVINQLNFVNDNFGGAAYIDRIAINNEEALTTQEIVKGDLKFSIYQSYTTNDLYIKSKDKVKSVKIHDMLGQLLLVDTNDIIDISKLEIGTYMITIETKKGIYYDKFLKK